MRKYPKIVAFFAFILVAPMFSVFTANASVLLAPTLISPTSGQVLTNYPRMANFSWTANSGASKYQVEITCDVCVSKTDKWQGAAIYTATGNSFSTQLPGDNQFRWRVRGVDSNNQSGEWTAYGYFSYNTKTNAPVTGVPTITAPTQYQTFTDINSTITGRWTAVANAQKYQAELYRGSSLVWVGYTSNTYYSVNLRSVSYRTSINGDYHGRVRAVFSGNACGSWSDSRYFSINTGSNSLDAPVITIPSAGQGVDWDYTDFHWNAVANAQTYFVTLEYAPGGTWKHFADYQTGNTYVIGEGIWDNNYRVKIRAQLTNGSYTNWSDWRYFRVDAYSGTDLTIPTLNSPADESHLTSNNVTLDWTVVSGATAYTYQVTRFNGSFWVLVTENTAYGSDATVTLSSGVYGQYSFRVRALRNGSYGDWSEYNHFYYDNGANYSAPSISNPSQNALIENTTRQVYMNWQAVSGVSTYEVEVVRDSNSAVTQLYPGSNTSVYFNPSSDDAWYHFRVRGKDYAGNYTNWSDYRWFRYHYTGNGSGATTAAPVISAPNAGQSFSGRNIYSTWSDITNAVSYEVNVAYRSGNNWYEERAQTALDNGTTMYFGYDNRYRLRVRGKFSDGTYTNWSDWREFYVNANGGTYTGSTPAITAPANNASINQNSRTVNLGWSSVHDAVSYDIEVSCDYCTANASQWTYYNSFTTASSELSFWTPGTDNTYRFRVRARMNDSSYTSWSDYSQFHYFQTNQY